MYYNLPHGIKSCIITGKPPLESYELMGCFWLLSTEEDGIYIKLSPVDLDIFQSANILWTSNPQFWISTYKVLSGSNNKVNEALSPHTSISIQLLNLRRRLREIHEEHIYISFMIEVFCGEILLAY